jgi:1,2-phenylacetyl-CoA epoxidase catalytic subunit
MKNYQNAYTICNLTNKEIFSNEFAKQPVNELFASILTLLVKDTHEGNGYERVEKAIQNSYTKDMQKKIFYTLGILLKNYN